ncbi:uroporphyrinogen-III synthase [Kordiimonas sp.]|uniref:uroporphyrinogen-III synthase n=1 Tax=Kordiimonas sp. TaxID=1970157 RepID=UPI003A9565BD
MSTILLTRPIDEAQPTAEKLEAMGHTVIIAPMIRIDPVSFEIPPDDRSLIVTSKNGARHGLANIGNKARPIFAVGEQTAEEARKLGFTNVVVGPGTARQMIPTLLECGISEKRKYSYLCGTNISYNISAVLRDEGIDAVDVVTYQARPMRAFSAGVQDAMEEGEIDIALFYSPRTATTFEETAAEYGRSDWLSKMDAIALSTRVREQLIGPWRSVRYAIMPTEKALLSMLEG